LLRALFGWLGGGSVKNRQPAGLIIRYTDGSEARVVLLSKDDGANGFTTLAEWIDAKTLILELEDRVLLLLEQEDRVLTIPVQDIENIEFAPQASKLVH
jgi:hypothetical protein